jgi:transcriptional regulator with XRE-family HTH domain
MPMKMPDPLDAVVGARIRLFRNHRGMSQTALGEKIGVSCQQVQKYERGTNRVGASRLAQIASVLDVPISDLFETSTPSGSMSPFKLLAEPGALQVLKAYVRVIDPRTRRAIVKLIEGIADHQQTIERSTSRQRLARRGGGRLRTAAPR